MKNIKCNNEISKGNTKIEMQNGKENGKMENETQNRKGRIKIVFFFHFCYFLLGKFKEQGNIEKEKWK